MARDIKFEGKYLNFVNHDGWEFVERKNCTGIVIILALTDNHEVIFVEQFRKAVGKSTIEFCAGLIGDHDHAKEESLEEGAIRELEEETGYRAKRIEQIMEGPANAGISCNMVVLMRAYDLTLVSEGGGDHEEDIKVHVIPAKEVDGWLRAQYDSGKAIDPKVYGGLYHLNLR
jgi:ADP-ribose pyrophosphatase